MCWRKSKHSSEYDMDQMVLQEQEAVVFVVVSLFIFSNASLIIGLPQTQLTGSKAPS